MIFEPKHFTLKDGRSAVLHTPRAEDAEQLVAYLQTTCAETEFLARYPEERTITVEQERAWVERVRNSPSSLAITCYVGGKVAGNCEINFLGSIKTRHRAVVAIAILKEYWGQGIGSAMFGELISAAKAHGTEIVELEYLEGNERARRLYEKFGFRAVCQKLRAYKLKDGTYLAEITMQKDLTV